MRVTLRPACVGFFFLTLLTHVLCDTSSPSTSSSTTSTSPAHSDVCTIKGTLYTERSWSGYLLSKPLINFARIIYTVAFPADQGPAKLAIYYQEQIDNITAEMTCQERLDVLGKHQNNQIEHLNTQRCQVVGTADGTMEVVCAGTRFIRSSESRRWYIVVARCGSTGPVELRYTFNVTGYLGDCYEDPVAPYQLPSEKTDQQTCACEPEVTVDYTKAGCDGNLATGLLWSSEQKTRHAISLAVLVFFGLLNIRAIGK